MKLAVTNLSFEGSAEDYLFLQQCDINYLEVCPAKDIAYKDLTRNDFIDLDRSTNLYIYSFLSLFYNIDVSIKDTEKMLEQFVKLKGYLSTVNGKVMVFGSPGLRKKIPGWKKHITELFTSVDKLLHDTKMYVIIEPVAKKYGAEFFTTIDEIVEFLKENKFKNIYTMIDTHNLKLEKQDPVEKFKEYEKWIKHIHVSEIDLVGIRDIESHIRFSKVLKKHNYKHVITHEINDKVDFRKSAELFGGIYK
ncbi:MAG: sugar phosphate isomerase/epimerase family protein [Methylococcales bacterium]